MLVDHQRADSRQAQRPRVVVDAHPYEVVDKFESDTLRGEFGCGTVTVVGELDAAWRSVRDMLGTAAQDYSAAVAAVPASAARGVSETVARSVETDAANVPALRAAFSDVIATTATSSTYVRGRALIDEVDYSALPRATGTSSWGTNPTFEAIQRLQRFDRPGTIATPEQVNAAIAAGGQQLFRGFEEDRYLEDFITGPVRPGIGPMGTGTYATPLEEVALHYTDPTHTRPRYPARPIASDGTTPGRQHDNPACTRIRPYPHLGPTRS